VFDRNPAARNAREVLDMPSTMTGLMTDPVRVGMVELMCELIRNFTRANHFCTTRKRNDPRARPLADLDGRTH